LDIIRPAEIDVPIDIQSIIIVNRSLPSKNNQVENILDGIFSGENIGDDKEGSEMCVVGLKNSLNRSVNQTSRFKIIDADGFMSGDYLRGTGTSDFPKPIKWKKINKVFSNYNIDGLIVLETFDSNLSTMKGSLVEKTQLIKGKKTKVPLIEAVLNIEVYSGWRIYDIKNQKIIDEKTFIDQKSFTSTGLTFLDAKQKLPNKRTAISETGIFSGEQYAIRISPTKETVNRLFYKKAKKSAKKENDAFHNASEFFKLNNIAASASIWMKYVNHDDAEIAGRACFNMAVASELKNKYNLALDWIEKSIAYNNKKATHYSTILENRKFEIKQVDKQLKK